MSVLGVRYGKDHLSNWYSVVDLNQPLSDYKSPGLTFDLTEHMAGDERIELPPTESKSAALPLHQSPILVSVCPDCQASVPLCHKGEKLVR